MKVSSRNNYKPADDTTMNSLDCVSTHVAVGKLNYKICSHKNIFSYEKSDSYMTRIIMKCCRNLSPFTASPHQRARANLITARLFCSWHVCVCVWLESNIRIHNHNFLCNNFIIEPNRASGFHPTRPTCGSQFTMCSTPITVLNEFLRDAFCKEN